MRNYELIATRDGDVVHENYEAADQEAAEEHALVLMSKEFRQTWATYDDAVSDCDGVTLEESLQVAALRLYRRLADGLSEMVEEGRLTEGDVPDDYQWLCSLLEQIAGADPSTKGEE